MHESVKPDEERNEVSRLIAATNKGRAVIEGSAGSVFIDRETAIDAILADRARPPQDAKPVAWRSPVMPFGQPGYVYAETEERLVEMGRHDRQPLYASLREAAQDLVERMDEHGLLVNADAIPLRDALHALKSIGDSDGR